MGDIDEDALQDTYQRIAKEIGVENMLKIYRLCRGEQISFPLHMYSRERVISAVKKQYDGTNLRELADRYGYSRRWLRSVLKNSSQLETNNKFI
ncbi:Mor transcription activator family protein [Furfurilactobacillus curtus]|uniref:Mor transcription activator domain-containing protein n=1 Tax=Furfurilactobacillus curtus TaxID=1746200 RepID=A0ABQ5JLN4_9LACO